MPTQTSTGDFRAFLIKCAEEVKAGSLPVDQASQVSKLAAQVNESLHAELRAASVQSELKGKLKLGTLSLAKK